MADFESAYKIVCELVRDFKGNETRYLSSQYQEAEVRRDFIDKFFEALGWDVYHKSQKNPYEQEVKVEKGISIGKAQKRADYAFYITPEYRQPKYFAEAKKPSRNLKNADDYFQTIRYGWNANTKIAVLTDFEEFHILDCRFKPNINNVLENPNHKTFTYADYTDIEKFKEIYYLFSRNEVAKNSLEKYSENFSKIKGKAKTYFKSSIEAIDDDFLEYIDEVREKLAKAFKKIDSKITSEELTEATQRTIDRLVFIRFLEDKLIEPEYYISELGKKGNSWNEFITVCKKLDAKYNGIVFKKHFIDEQNFQGPEQGTFKKICDEMSNLNSPYDFNAIPIHILGSIYERFLGKVVNATAQRVKVEEKPEVRKAGGVYYTPKYIVDYIVENTVGKLIQGKTNSEISKLRFADIACGSGSFLIGVFETLLKYHTEFYQLHPEQAKKDGCINKDGQWILSIKQKQKILLNNIYGVDIDNQAVEVTQLSLALKMLEDESTATANEMQVLFHEKILPDLSKNIVCGNSLIGTDILQGKIFPSDEERKLNPMDFETTFPEIMRNGGFDAIVGNPPYGAELNLVEKKYLANLLKTSVGNSNTYVMFLEKSLKHLRENGISGLLTPTTFLTGDNFKLLRQYLLTSNILSIIKLPYNTFKDAYIDTCIIITQKNGYKEVVETANIPPKEKLYNSNDIGSFVKIITKKEWKNSNKREFIISDTTNIIRTKIFANNIFNLEDISKIDRGTLPPKKFITEITDNKKHYYWFSGQIYRYNYVKELLNIITTDDLKEFKSSTMFNGERILIRQLISRQFRVNATIVEDNFAFKKNLYCVYIIDNGYSSKYLLGLINSRLFSYYIYNSISGMQKNDFPSLSLKDARSLPIRKIDFAKENEKQSHDKIVSLVEQMLEAKKQLQNAKTDRDKTYYERRCNDLDSAIDSEVYKLYGLTEEERKIVESN